MGVEAPAAPCPRALPVTLAQAVEVLSEMKITRPGQLGSTSSSSPNILDLQGPALAERAKLKAGRSGLAGQTVPCTAPPRPPKSSCQADPRGPAPPQWQKSSVLHSICQGWRGQLALGLALCQALQEGGGSILRLLQDPALARLRVSARGGEGDWHPGHLSLRRWARRHLQCEEGPSCAAAPQAGPRAEARPRAPWSSPAPRGPPRLRAPLAPSTFSARDSVDSPQKIEEGPEAG